VAVTLVAARADCQVFDDQSPVLSVVTDTLSLTLRAADAVTDDDVKAGWALIDAMRVYVLALERQHDRRTSDRRPPRPAGYPGRYPSTVARAPS
jgi:hypothetical protein